MTEEPKYSNMMDSGSINKKRVLSWWSCLFLIIFLLIFEVFIISCFIIITAAGTSFVVGVSYVRVSQQKIDFGFEKTKKKFFFEKPEIFY